MPPFFRIRRYTATAHNIIHKIVGHGPPVSPQVGLALLFGHHIHIWQEDVGQVKDAVDPLCLLADGGHVLEQVVDVAGDG